MKNAYVSGNKWEGYKVQLDAKAAKYFSGLSGVAFETFKPAQSIANAINAFLINSK